MSKRNLSLADPSPVRRPRVVNLAREAWNVVPCRLRSVEHCASVGHLFRVGRAVDPVLESIAAEVSPEITAAAEHSAVPVDLGRLPELEADVFHVIVMFLGGEFNSRGGAGSFADSGRCDRIRSCFTPREFDLESHSEVTCHGSRFGDFVCVMLECYELPCHDGKHRPMLFFPGVDDFDVLDDVVERATDAILPVSFLLRSVDRASERAKAVADERIEYFFACSVEIDAVIGAQDDASSMCFSENSGKLRIEKCFTVVRQLGFANVRTRIEKVTEVRRGEESTTDRVVDRSNCCWARGTAELAVRGCLDSDAIWVNGLHWTIED